MTTEQREAIDRLKKYIEEDDFYNIYKEIKEDEREGKIGGTHIVFCKAIDIALSLIKEQEIYIKKYNDTTEEMNRDIRKFISEIQKKDKQIDLMADFMYKTGTGRKALSCVFRQNDECNENGCEYCIKRYFAGLVERNRVWILK